MATAGLLAFMGPLDNAERNEADWTRFRLDREGRPYPPEIAVGARIVRGIPEEIILRLAAQGAAEVPTFGYIPVNIEALKYLLETLLLEAGVRLQYYTTVAAAEAHVEGVTLTLANKAGLQQVSCRRVIDATGDGDVAAFLAAEVGMGREADGKTQGVTLVFRLGNVQTDPLDFLPDSPSYQQVRQQATAAFARGEFSFNPGGIGCVSVVPGLPGVFMVNHQHTYDIQGTNPDDLTFATLNGRRQIQELVRFYQQYVPGCEGCYLLDTANQLGVRETRRIIGDYVLTRDDILDARSFPDSIVKYAYMLDIHLPGETSEGGRTELKPGTAYEIPYRCLLPKGLDNVLVAGRCISTTHEALSSIRLMTCCMAMGQAAGTAAALSLREAVAPRDLDVTLLQDTLRHDGALV
jgi:hypothetical protein